MKKRVFSGMRPTGSLHLGHLVGALENWVAMQVDYECIYGIVDWHALTSEYQSVDPIAGNVVEIALDWLAAGIDPEQATIMVQSMVPEHAELHLLFSMITPTPWLERVPTYKEQIHQLSDKDLSTYGFLGYPLLQSADILIYKAERVPVGEDQVSHIELSREVARRFNHLYGTVFPEPKAKLTKSPRLPGTDGRKMSKSYDNVIQLSDPPDLVRKKMLTMVTDPARKRRNDPGDPDVCPVFDHHKIFSTEADRSWVREGCTTAGIGCVDCKERLLGNILPRLEPIYERRKNLAGSRETVVELLHDGSRKAREIASQTLEEVRQAMKIQY